MKGAPLLVKIKHGTVIDHIPSQNLFRVIRLLELEKKLSEQDNRMSFGTNLISQKLGKKALIKLENVFLTAQDCATLTIFAPYSSVNVIEDSKVVKKFTLQVPEKISVHINCLNRSCITRLEGTPSTFKLAHQRLKNSHQITLTCDYCEKSFLNNELLI